MISSILYKTIPRTLARRNISTTMVKRSADPVIGHIDQESQIGKNLPFNIHRRIKLAVLFVVYFGSGFTVPFFAVRLQLLKKNSS